MRAAVTAWLEQVGTCRYWREPERRHVGEISGIDAGRKGNRQPVAELPAETPQQRHRQHVQRRAGEVHLRLAGREERAVIAHPERVAEFHAEAEPQRLAGGAEALAERRRLVPARVGGERRVRHLQFGVVQPFVEQRVQVGAAEQRRVQLHHDVQAVRAHQELGDALDFLRRAAVERRECQRVGEPRRIGKITKPPVGVGDLAAQPVDDRGRVQQAVDERLHLLRADAGEVVADAHVQHRVAEPRRQRQLAGCLQHLDQHRRFYVFRQRPRQRQFLRPLHVIADRRHVDAGARQDQHVLHLHRLQLDHPAAGEPRQYDVLRQLRVRPGGRAERRGGASPMHPHRHVPRCAPEHEAPRRQVEDGAARLQLAEHPADEQTERKRGQTGHGLLRRKKTSLD